MSSGDIDSSGYGHGIIGLDGTIAVLSSIATQCVVEHEGVHWVKHNCRLKSWLLRQWPSSSCRAVETLHVFCMK